MIVFHPIEKISGTHGSKIYKIKISWFKFKFLSFVWYFITIIIDIFDQVKSKYLKLKMLFYVENL